MGSYSTLAIGEVSLAWKYEVPTYLTFLFREQDLYIEREEPLPSEAGEAPHPPEDYEIRRAGFRTTVAAARKALDGHGYTLDFFAGIYDSFLPNVEEEVREVLEEELGSRAAEGTSAEEIERQAAAHLTAQPPTALGDLEAFVAFLKSALASDFRMPPFTEALEDSPWLWPPAGSANAGILGDFDNLQTLFLDRAPDIAAAVLRPLRLLSEGWLFQFAEVLSLLYARLVLDASDPGATVDLEVSEIVEGEASLRALHIDLAFMLLHKVDVYERVFKALSERESDVRDRYNRQRARSQLETLDTATNPQQRGDALEQLMAVIFSLPPELEVRERNYRSANEEIDIVLKNNVPRPFWQALNSPLIFVECKNWRHKIKSEVVNRFERKLKNHAPQARVGVLVAPKGLTAGARTAIRDSAKEAVLIVAIERADLDSLAKNGRSILDWMEVLLSRPV